MSSRILLIDDDLATLKSCRAALSADWEVDTFDRGTAGLEALSRGAAYAAVVADLHMPDMSGLDVLIEARRRAPETVRLMLTGVDDPTASIDAINAGRVFRFLKKPCRFDALVSAVGEAVDEHRRILRERTALDDVCAGAVQLLTRVLSEVDPAAVTTGQGLAARAKELGQRLNLGNTRDVETAALLLHVGMITLPVSVNAKIRAKKPLTPGESDALRHLPELGAQLLGQIQRLAHVAEIVRYQGKGFDGIGQPVDEVRGTQIPLGARLICPLLDLHEFEAGGLSSAQAMKKLQERAARYDPSVLAELARLADEWTVHGTRRQEARLISELHEGMELERDVMTTDGFRIAAAGTRLTESAIERLRNFVEQGRVRDTMFVVFVTPPQPDTPAPEQAGNESVPAPQSGD